MHAHRTKQTFYQRAKDMQQLNLLTYIMLCSGWESERFDSKKLEELEMNEGEHGKEGICVEMSEWMFVMAIMRILKRKECMCGGWELLRNVWKVYCTVYSMWDVFRKRFMLYSLYHHLLVAMLYYTSPMHRMKMNTDVL